MLVFLLLLAFDDSTKLLERGMAAFEANDLATAHANFADAARQSPTHPGIWMMLAQTCARQGDMKAAQESADKAQRFGAKDPAVLQGLANFYASEVHDLARAASVGARYAQLAPQDTGAWQRVAAMYLSAGKPDQAIDAGRRGKPTAELHVVLAKAYAARKEWPKSDAEFAEAIRGSAYDEEFRFAAAQAHLERLDFAGAESVLIDARKIFDKSPQLELTLGVAYYGERKFAKAVDQFLLTASLAPDLPQPYAFLGRILEHAGDRLPEIADRFAGFEQRNPKSPLGYLLHAKALMMARSTEIDTALALVEKSVALQEADADAQLQLGVLLYRKGDLASAAAHLERSVQLNANESAAHFQLARVYSGLGRKEDAARERVLHEKLASQEAEERKQ